MTTLVVQTPGDIVTGANSYLSVTDSNTLATKYGMTAWVASTADKTVPLFLAAQFLESTYGPNFSGSITSDTQSMSWPRTTFYDTRGLKVEKGAIPEAVLLAQLQLADATLNGTDLQANPDSSSNLSELTETVEGDVSRTRKWFSPTAQTTSAQVKAGKTLLPYLSGATAMNRTVRA